MKPLGSHAATERTNRRQEQEFRMTLIRGGFACLGKRRWGKCKGVLDREPTCEGETSSERVAGMRWGMREQKKGRKPGHQSVGWWVPGESIFCALIRAVCTDVRGPAENSHLLSCDGGFLRSFRDQMRGFHDLDGFVAGAPSTWCRSNGPSAQCRPDRTHRACYILPASSAPGRPCPTLNRRSISVVVWEPSCFILSLGRANGNWGPLYYFPPASYIIKFRLADCSANRLLSRSSYSSTQNLKAICSSKTSVGFQRTTWRYIPEDSTLLFLIQFDAFNVWNRVIVIK
jgi:hypothetical protein